MQPRPAITPLRSERECLISLFCSPDLKLTVLFHSHSSRSVIFQMQQEPEKFLVCTRWSIQQLESQIFPPGAGGDQTQSQKRADNTPLNDNVCLDV